MTKETYDLITKKVLKDYMGWDAKTVKPEQAFIRALKH
jgi:hypothetical protein